MTAPLLDRLEELLRAGTDRPWHRETTGNRGVKFERVMYDAAGLNRGATFIVCTVEGTENNNANDADLIVAAVNSLPALLRVARAAEAWRDADERLKWGQSPESVIDEYELRRSQLRSALAELDKEQAE